MTYRILADENFPSSIAHWLAKRGHDVIHVATSHSGVSDEQLLALAQVEKRVLLTFDHGFGQLVFRYGLNLPGLVFFRFGERSRGLIHLLLRGFFESAPKLEGFFTVVRPGYVRQTLLPR